MAGGGRRDSVRSGMVTAAPVSAVVAVFGASFGVLAHTAGYSPLAAVLMSATTFAGSAQFAAASVLAEGGILAAAIAAALMLNARYGPIGLSVAPFLPDTRIGRFFLAQLVVDESWAIAASPEGTIESRRLVGAGLMLYAGWVIGTAVGALAGGAFAEPEALGLDAAFPALFLGLLATHLHTPRGRFVAIAGAMIALTLVPLAPPGVPILAAALGAAAGARGK